jgi:hypothetical protein
MEAEGEPTAQFKLYVLGMDQYGKPDQPVEKVAEFWTEEEVLAFRPRADHAYGLYVRRRFILLHELRQGKRP